jgi:O-methyltransferase
MPLQTSLGRALVEDYLTLADDSAVAVLPHALRVFVDLRLPEELGDEGRTVADLTARTGVPADALRRLLLALRDVDVVRDGEDDRFRLSDLGEKLLPGGDARVSVANLDSQQAWAHATGALRDGGLAFAAGYQHNTFFAHKDLVPEANRAFLTRMRERARRCYSQTPSAVDWTGVRAVLDIGGGDGYLLEQVLTAVPHVTGRLFDRPATLDLVDAPSLRMRFPERWDAVAGDFFTGLPTGADLHLMASVLHDWSDDDVVTILKHSRVALEPDGRLVLIEMLLPEDGRHPHFARWSDLGMMVLTGGRERSQGEYERLLVSAGYELRSVTLIPGSGFSAICAG